MVTNCYWLLKKILDFTNLNIRDSILFPDKAKQRHPLHIDDSMLPSRRTDVNFSMYSAVSEKELMCHYDSRSELWGKKGFIPNFITTNRKLPGYHNGNLEINSSNTTIPQWRNENNIAITITRTVDRNKSGRTPPDFLSFLNREEVSYLLFHVIQ